MIDWGKVRWTASGFGVQNRFVVAEPSHAGYVTRYISARLPDLAPLRRADGFSRRFLRAQSVKDQQEAEEVLAELGAEQECHWEPSAAVAALLRR